MNVFLIIVGVLVVIAVAALVAVLVTRRRYIASLKELGWTFVDHPSLQAAAGLNHPPFGLGTGREIDDQIVGTTSSGTTFQAFEYKSSAHRGGGYVAAVRLDRPMPEFYHFPTNRPRAIAGGVVVAEQGGFTTVASDQRYGQAMLAAMAPTLSGFASPPNLSIDHDQLVALGAPKKAEDLRAFLEALDQTARAITGASTLQGYSAEAAPGHLSVYGHPRWEYRRLDSSLLSVVDHTGGGRNHTAEDVLLSHHPQLPFIALTHTWETTRTETSTNSDGSTSTRTVTDHHTEYLLEFHPQFTFMPFKVNRGLMGDRVQFESAAFNKAFTVRCTSPRFASDVFHPRQLEYLMARRPFPFEWTSRGVISISAPTLDPHVLANCEDFLVGFFGRVPRFTWQFLGYQQPPVPHLRGDI